MKPPMWFSVVAWAEIVFVVSLFVVETVRYVLVRRMEVVERALHPISDDRYFAYFFVPAAASIAFVLVVSGNVVATVPLAAVFLYYCSKYAGRDLPRPLSRARLRRALAEADERLSSDAPLTESDAARLRHRLVRIGRVGDHLLERGASLEWREALRKESRWLVAAALAATAVPLVGLVWIGMRPGQRGEEGNEAESIVLLSTAIAAVAIAMFLRLSRTRRELGHLGLELGAGSRRLVGQLTSVMTAGGVVPDPQAARSNKVFVIFGRDMEVNKRMSDFLRALGLEPMEWEHLMSAAGSPLAHIGHAVATGLSAGAAQAVVALFTPDDVVMLHPHLDGDSPAPALFQARPNVLLELGRAMTTYPNQTIVVAFGRHLRPISDLDGLSVVRFDGSNTAESIGRLTVRLRQAGCPVRGDGTDWLDTDRFTGLDAYERRPFLPPG